MFKFAKIKNNYVPKSEPYWMCMLDNPDNFMSYMKIRMTKLNEDYTKLKQRLADWKKKSESNVGYHRFDEDKDGLGVNTNMHFASKEEIIINATLRNNPNRKSVVDDIFILSDKIIYPLQKAFFNGNIIFVNAVGGWLTKTDKIEVLETIEKDTFEFPKEGKSRKEYIDMIKIVKWEGGNHYYARIGHEDVIDADGNVKWNTHDEAHRQAVAQIDRDLTNN